MFCRKPIKCSDESAQYSFTTGKCFDANGVIDMPMIYSNDEFVLQKTYRIDTNGETGRLYFPLELNGNNDIIRGSLVGYNRFGSTGKIAAIEVESGGDGHFGIWDTLLLSQTTPRASYQHLYRAFVAGTTQFQFHKTYPPEWPIGFQDIEVVLSNRVSGSRKIPTTVFVADPLYNISIEAPDYGELDFIHELLLVYLSLTISDSNYSLAEHFIIAYRSNR